MLGHIASKKKTSHNGIHHQKMGVDNKKPCQKRKKRKKRKLRLLAAHLKGPK
jgi:hypothetical protein